jgi:hypothetical protein
VCCNNCCQTGPVSAAVRCTQAPGRLRCFIAAEGRGCGLQGARQLVPGAPPQQPLWARRSSCLPPLLSCRKRTARHFFRSVPPGAESAQTQLPTGPSCPQAAPAVPPDAKMREPCEARQSSPDFLLQCRHAQEGGLHPKVVYRNLAVPQVGELQPA